MLKQFLSHRNLLLAGSVFSLAILFTACKKDNNNVDQPALSGLMAFNLAPDQQSVSVAISGNLLGGIPLSYGSYTGNYFNVYPGPRRVESYSSFGNELLDSVTTGFEQGKFYSVFVVGENDNYRNIVVMDDYDSLTASSGKAYVRYINAIPGSGSNVGISAGGSSVVNRAAAFGEVSSFLAVDPGSLSVQVSNEAASNANRDITVAGQKAYTILLMRAPDESSADSVQIRFIENGTITD